MVGEIWLIIALFSIFLLVFFIGFIFFTPIGKESFGRWINKRKFNKGGWANAIIFTKDNLCKEVFSRVIDGTFTVNDNPYVRVPQLSFPYKGMQTSFYIEGTSTPIDILSKDRQHLLSCNELDIVMNHQLNFNFKEWFSKNKMYILIGFGIIILSLVVSIYFNYTMYEWIRDSAPTIKDGVVELTKSKVV